jgi:hypothetical protein
MENNSRWNQKEEQQQSAKPGIISQDDKDTPRQFKDGGTEKEKRCVRHSILSHIFCCPFEILNLIDPGIQKNQN